MFGNKVYGTSNPSVSGTGNRVRRLVLLPPTENCPTYRGYADSILTQVFYLPCLIFWAEKKG